MHDVRDEGEKLMLARRSLGELPRSLFVPTLQTVDLGQNRLRWQQVGWVLGACPALLYLNVSYNRFDSADQGDVAMDRAHGLLELRADGCDLVTVPRFAASMPSLRTLSLAHNKSLTHLDLSLVQQVYPQVHHLTAVYCGIDQVTCSGDSLSGPPSLINVELRGNPLTSLAPSTWRALRLVRRISLGESQLTAIPDTWGHLLHLEGFFCPEARLACLPASAVLWGSMCRPGPSSTLDTVDVARNPFGDDEALARSANARTINIDRLAHTRQVHHLLQQRRRSIVRAALACLATARTLVCSADNDRTTPHGRGTLAVLPPLVLLHILAALHGIPTPLVERVVRLALDPTTVGYLGGKPDARQATYTVLATYMSERQARQPR